MECASLSGPQWHWLQCGYTWSAEGPSKTQVTWGTWSISDGLREGASYAWRSCWSEGGALPRRDAHAQGAGTYRQAFQELASLGELVAVGTFTPADGPHQHHDGRKEALFQGLILCRSGPRAQIRLRAQELMGESKKGGPRPPSPGAVGSG